MECREILAWIDRSAARSRTEAMIFPERSARGACHGSPRGNESKPIIIANCLILASRRECRVIRRENKKGTGICGYHLAGGRRRARVFDAIRKNAIAPDYEATLRKHRERRVSFNLIRLWRATPSRVRRRKIVGACEEVRTRLAKRERQSTCRWRHFVYLYNVRQINGNKASS